MLGLCFYVLNADNLHFLSLHLEWFFYHSVPFLHKSSVEIFPHIFGFFGLLIVKETGIVFTGKIVFQNLAELGF